MSAAEQLELGVTPTPKKPSKLQKICKCLHEDRDHARGKGPCSFGAHVGNPCTCKRFKPRGRPVVVQPRHLLAPPGAIVLERDDTTRAKAMGWALVGARAITIYLEQLKTKSLNVSWTSGNVPGYIMKQRFAALAAYKKTCKERVESAIAQCGAEFVLVRGRPKVITITRVSSGSLDDDNLAGALKHIRDGIAGALDFDDKELSSSGSAGKIPLFLVQEKPGGRRVCGVRIAIGWEATS